MMYGNCGECDGEADGSFEELPDTNVGNIRPDKQTEDDCDQIADDYIGDMDKARENT